MIKTSIRAYERSDLPLEERLPSLARRFASLGDAPGIDPWDPGALHRWVAALSASEDAARHAGLFVLNLSGGGDWAPFDVLAAARVWCEEDRQAFINWMRVWRFDED